MRIAVIIILSGVFAACVSAPKSNNKQRSQQVNPGDTREQVVALMGAPQDRQFNAKREALGYCDNGPSYTGNYTTIWLESGKVTSITHDTNYHGDNHCSAHFRQLDL